MARGQWITKILSRIQGSESTLKWYHRQDFPIAQRILVLGASTLLGWFAISGPWGEFFHSRVARSVHFRLRHFLKKDPKLDPRIKVYAIGDSALSTIGAEDLDLETWAALLTAIDARNPEAIYIDKVFGTPVGIAMADAFRERLKRIRAPVVVGAFLSPAPLRKRPIHPLDRPENDLRSWLKPNDLRPSWLKNTSLLPYGPHPSIADAFTHIGHLEIDDSRARALTMVPSGRVLPLAPLLLSVERGLRDGVLFLDGKKAPVDQEGHLLVNMGHPDVYDPVVFSLGPVISDVRKGERLDQIAEGSLVVLLTGMFTGTRNYVTTPWGNRASGYHTLALINSVLTGAWIRPFYWDTLLVFLWAGLGLLLAWRLTPRQFWLITPIAFGLCALSGPLVFVYLATESYWLGQLVGFGTSALGGFIVRARNASHKAAHLRYALEGSFPIDKVEAVLANKSKVWLSAGSMHLTILFLDIVGFSNTAKVNEAKRVFLELRDILDRVTQIIHRHGGIVDKTLGDGLLAYFGYRPEGGNDQVPHALRALNCAVEIQLRQLEANLTAAAQKHFIFPVRIGLHSDDVLVGDLGGKSRVDLTIIGHGVNHAKRMETACEPNLICLSPKTREELPFPPDGLTLRRKLTQVKHHTGLTEVYECDPCENQPRSLQRSRETFWRLLGLERAEPRIEMPTNAISAELMGLGVGSVVNFSESGLCVELNSYLCPGVRAPLLLFPTGSLLAERLGGMGLGTLAVEVRWGTPIGERFLHGLQFQIVTRESKKRLWEVLAHEKERLADRKVA